jgi:hypothetical protein
MLLIKFHNAYAAQGRLSAYVSSLEEDFLWTQAASTTPAAVFRL